MPNRVRAMWRARNRALYRAPWTAPELGGMPCFLRPDCAWPIVPAKKIPGTDALSKNGVSAGSRLWPNVATPSAGRSRSGATNPVAAMTSSAATVISDALSVRRIVTRRPSSARSTFSIDALRMPTPPPIAWSSYGWR